MIVIAVQPTNRYGLLRTFQLSLDETLLALLCVSIPNPLWVHSCRLVRKRCGVWIKAISTATRMGQKKAFSDRSFSPALYVVEFLQRYFEIEVWSPS
jgi:hypothetical protein